MPACMVIFRDGAGKTLEEIDCLVQIALTGRRKSTVSAGLTPRWVTESITGRGRQRAQTWPGSRSWFLFDGL